MSTARSCGFRTRSSVDQEFLPRRDGPRRCREWALRATYVPEPDSIQGPKKAVVNLSPGGCLANGSARKVHGTRGYCSCLAGFRGTGWMFGADTTCPDVRADTAWTFSCTLKPPGSVKERAGSNPAPGTSSSSHGGRRLEHLSPTDLRRCRSSSVTAKRLPC
jgi:hypothetical protein